MIENNPNSTAMLNDTTKKNVTLLTTIVRGVGRDNAIERWIAFHRKFGVPLIVVGDLEGKYRDFQDNIQFIRTENSLSVASKLLLGLENVVTPYVAWVADDDFILGMMLEKSVAILQAHKEIAACDGLNIFLKEGTGKRAYPSYSVKQFIALRRTRVSGLNEHIMAHAENFAPLALHGVVRTEALQEAISIGSKVPVRWGDNVCMAIVLSKGRIAMVPSISNIRSHATRILEHAKSFHTDADIPKEALVLDRPIKEKILASFGAEIQPSLHAAVEYFLLRSSGGLSFTKTPNRLVTKLSRYWLSLCGYFYFIYWYLSNNRIRNEIMQIRKLVREYPLMLN